MNSTHRRVKRLNIIVGAGWTTAILALILTCLVGYQFLTDSISGALALFLALYFLCFGWGAATVADQALGLKHELLNPEPDAERHDD